MSIVADTSIVARDSYHCPSSVYQRAERKGAGARRVAGSCCWMPAQHEDLIERKERSHALVCRGVGYECVGRGWL